VSIFGGSYDTTQANLAMVAIHRDRLIVGDPVFSQFGFDFGY
jgi:hypothetical protein